MSSNVNKSVHFEWMFLELIQIRDECMVRIGGQSRQYGAILQEMINLKRFKFTDPHKESRTKTGEKSKDNGYLQDMCKNHRDSVTWNTHGGLATEKKKRICKIYHLWVTVITPDICQIWQKTLMGNGKWYCFVWRNNLFKFEASIRQNMLQARNIRAKLH